MEFLVLLNTLRKHGIRLEGQDGNIRISGAHVGPDLLAAISTHKAQLLQLLNGEQQRVAGPVPVTATAYPLTALQQSVWTVSQTPAASVAYNVPLIVRLEPEGLDVPALEQAVQDMVQRHEALRYYFYADEKGQLWQECRQVQVVVRRHDVSGYSAAGLEDMLRAAAMEPVLLDQPPLLHASLLQAEDAWWLLLVIHHIVFDGRSQEIFTQELMQAYASRKAGVEPSFTALPLSLKDVASWEQQAISSQAFRREEQFWKQQLEGTWPTLQLQPGVRPVVKTNNGAHVRMTLPPALLEALEARCQQQRVSLFAGLQAVLQSLFYKYTGIQDLVTGTVIAGREHAGTENLVGLFIQTLPLRLHLRPEENFDSLLQQQQQVLDQAIAHAALPFPHLTTLLGRKRDIRHAPLFDILVIYNDHRGETAQTPLPGRLQQDDLRTTSQYDLTFTFHVYNTGAELHLEYNTDIYTAAFIQRLQQHIEQWLQSLPAAPAQALYLHQYLTAAERRQLLETFQPAPVDFPQETLSALFAAQVAVRPEAIALHFGDQSFTYAALDARSSQLAAYLAAHYAVGPDVPVAIHLSRNEWLVIAILAVLKTGSAYVPIAQDTPLQRCSFILQDSGAVACIDEKLLHDFQGTIDLWPVTIPAPAVTPQHLAYIIYTSGSTGTPKGCMVAHRGVVNRISWLWRHYGFTTADVILQKTNVAFDVSVGEIFMPLCWGCEMVLCAAEDVYAPERIAQLIATHGVTYVHFVAGMLDAFMAACFTGSDQRKMLHSLRYAFTSGEAVLPHTVTQWYDFMNIPLVNLYGPTEASIEVSYWETRPGPVVPIGRPIDNNRLYILDGHRQLCGLGVPGELYIGGVQLARGYLHLPALTTEKFVADPFHPGETLYRTGDLARWEEDGNIIYLGRADDQVKIRGYRIELGEIENNLAAAPGVQLAAIKVQETAGEKILSAYVVPENNFQKETVVAWLQERLPEYMVPVRWLTLENMPRHASGKLNRGALPDIDVRKSSGIRREMTMPEAQMASTWEQLFGITGVGPDDDFFDLGGHSLLAIRLIAAIQQSFQVGNVRFPDVFHHRTVAALTAHVLAHAVPTGKQLLPHLKTNEGELYPLSPAQQRLWLLQKMDGSNNTYNIEGRHRLPQGIQEASLQAAMEMVLERHEMLRTIFVEVDGLPYQQVLPVAAARYRIEQLDTVAANDLHDQVFELDHWPLFRVAMVQHNGYPELCYTVHHIITDAWSMDIFIRDLMLIYTAHLANQTPQLAPLAVTYKDYASWLQTEGNARYAADAAWWKAQLSGYAMDQHLPLDYDQYFNGLHTPAALYHIYVPPVLKNRMDEWLHSEGVSHFTFYMTCFQIMLSRLLSTPDVVIGMPVANRQHPDMMEVMGCFLNTLLVRQQVDGRLSFAALLQQVGDHLQEALARQEYPIEMLLEQWQQEEGHVRYTSLAPVFLNMLAAGNWSLESLDQYEPAHEAATTAAKFDLEIYFRNYKNVVEITAMYRTHLFKPETISYWMQSLVSLMATVLDQPGIAVADLQVFAPQPRFLMPVPQPYFTPWTRNEEATLVSCFEAQVALYPDKVALRDGETILTYAALNARANGLAHAILASPALGTQVALLLQHGIPAVVGMLGALKAGKTYVPLDPDMPVARLQYIVADTESSLLISCRETALIAGALAGDHLPLLQLDNIVEVAGNPGVSIAPTALAYLLYTSGSTGVPKGVMQSHRNVLHFIGAYTHNLHIHTGDRLSLLPAYTFDAAVMDIYGALLNGAALHIYHLKTQGLRQLAQWVEQQQISVLHIVPTLYRYFVAGLEDIVLPAVRLVVLGGEAVHRKDVTDFKRCFARGCILVNGYGPTESTVTLQQFLDHDTVMDMADVPVGYPVQGTEVFILKEGDQQAGIYEAGEIVYKSDHLALGYWKQEAATGVAFTPDPRTGEGRIYRSGDQGWRMPDGRIAFLGRKDGQVKINGQRVELGEIERRLEEQPGVAQAVVLAGWEMLKGKLLAYVRMKPGCTATPPSLLKGLREKLPLYMVPQIYTFLENFPLTHTGKTDRRALPLPAQQAPEQAYEAPLSEQEMQLAQSWQKLLQVPRVGRYDDFFLLGGNSLLAMQLLAVVKAEWNATLSIRNIFDNPLLHTMANSLQFGEMPAVALAADGADMEQAPLSFSQERLWFIDKLQGSLAYHLPVVLRLQGALDAARLEAAFAVVIARHETLRTVIREAGDNTWQHVMAADDWQMEYDQAFHLQDPVALEQYLDDYLRIPFNLSQDLMLRVRLVEIGQQEWILVIVMHHIATDGWSMSVLVQEMLTAYQQLSHHDTPQLPVLPLQYREYAMRQRREAAAGGMSVQLEYWRRQLHQVATLQLPEDEPRNGASSLQGGQLTQLLDKAMTRRLERYAQQQKVTLFMLLLSVFKVLMHRYSGQQDICVGTPVAGRDHASLAGMIGFFVNTLAIRSQVNGDTPYDDFLQEVKQTLLAAYEHQDLPFEQVAEVVETTRSAAHNAIFQVMFAMQNTPETAPIELDNITVKKLEPAILVPKFDLYFNVTPLPEGLELGISYRSDIYHHRTIEAMAAHYLQLLNAVLEEASIPLGKLNMLTGAERKQLLETFNDTKVSYPSGVTLTDLFIRQVAERPEETALVYQDRRFTFGELDQRSGRLAACLVQHGVEPGDLVAVLLPRSEWMIISILAILKTGGAYVPVDVRFPAERIEFILDDTAAKVCIDEAFIQRFEEAGDAVIYVPDDTAGEDDLAYVIYTSGSTGRPKGCMLAHKGVVNRLEWMWRAYNFQHTDVILQKTTYTFDVSVWELFLPLCWGCKMVLVEDADVYEPARLARLIQQQGVTTLHFVPAMLQIFMEQLFTDSAVPAMLLSIQRVVTSGEALGLHTVNEWYRHMTAPVYNLYGPTEASVDVSYFNTVPGLQKVLIGKPVANTTLYILDRYLEPVPVGVSGELHIGGVQLAKGYLNRDSLTREKFIYHPFLGCRLYKTGDLACWTADGNIEYLGRTDDQVKIRGYRITLGEIEHTLGLQDAVESCAVTVQKGDDGQPHLVAYFVGLPGTQPAMLREQLLRILPDYMVPSHLIQVEQMPVSANGKIDRKALQTQFGMQSVMEETTETPATALEQQLVGIWQEVLKQDSPMGVTADFFRLGGHSLRLMQLVNQYNKYFGPVLTLRELFEHTTIRRQAQLLQAKLGQSEEAIPRVPDAADYALSDGQRRLWMLSHLAVSPHAYYLSGQLPLRQAIQPALFEQAIRKVMERHEILRTVFFEKADGELRQRVVTGLEEAFHLDYQDVPGATPAAIRSLVSQADTAVFDLEQGPLLRAGLLRTAEEHFIFYYSMHHIISDGWSMQLMGREVLEIYQLLAAAREISQAPLSLQYRDFAAWQQQQLQTETFARHRDFWLQQFSGPLPVFNLPGAAPRPAMQTNNGYQLALHLPLAQYKAFLAYCQQQQATLYMGLMALLQALFYRYTGQEDMVMGSPVSGRSHATLETQLGFYVNTMAIRYAQNGDDSFAALLDRARARILACYEHQDYPFDHFVTALEQQRDTSRSALFDVFVNLQNVPNEMDDILGGDDGGEQEAIGEVIAVRPYYSKFDLLFNFYESDDDLLLTLEYNMDIYSRQLVSGLLQHLQVLMASVTASPELPLKQLPLLTTAEEERLRHQYNDTNVAYAALTTGQLITQMAAAQPEQPALQHEEQIYSYAQLDQLSTQTAAWLRQQGVQAGDIVGLLLPHSEWPILLMLACWKAGAAYLPIDPQYPAARVGFIVEDSHCRLLVDAARLLQLQQYLEETTVPAVAGHTSHELAYVIYTSGSTGTPKGVMVGHDSLRNYIGYCLDHYLSAPGRQYKVPLFTALSFDLTVTSIFATLAKGGTLVIYDAQQNIADTLQDIFYGPHAFNLVKCTPAHVGLLQPQGEATSTVTQLVIGGEALTDVQLDVLFAIQPDMTVYNEYGPTEATVGCVVQDITRGNRSHGGVVPIGKPVSNTAVYILDKEGALLPPGVQGELCLAGTCLALGYLGQPALTASRFVYSEALPGVRLYRSGDLATWREDGVLLYGGRTDDQVKVRGYRIEPGEIEAIIATLPGVSGVAVLYHAAGETAFLAAFVTGASPLDMTVLRTELSQKLPEYMVPTQWQQIDGMPLTSHGKTDRAALATRLGGQRTGAPYKAAGNEVEATLVALWEQVLQRSAPIGVNDNFFELGGDSIKAIKILSRVAKQYGMVFSMKQLFESPTVETLAAVIMNGDWPTAGRQQDAAIKRIKI